MNLPGLLDGICVLEIGDQKVEFCGRLLAGMGAEVIKIEPPGGSPTRAIGPFAEDRPDPERSLYFWQYNLGKKSVTLDLTTDRGVAGFRRLLERADVVLEGVESDRSPLPLEETGARAADGCPRSGRREDAPFTSNPDHRPPSEATLARLAPEESRRRLVWCAISDFGLAGPWRDYRASDLVHLALGGQMMVSGYPPGADGAYDTPPIAPQMWQAYQIAGEQACMDILAAVVANVRAGGRAGQFIDFSIHAACNLCTESFLAWYMAAGVVKQRAPQYFEAPTADGNYMVAMTGLFPGEFEKIVELMAEDGMAEDLGDEKYRDEAYRRLDPAAKAHIEDVLRHYIATQDSEALFHKAQARGVIWAPIRRPHVGLKDAHFVERGTFMDVPHPELGRALPYAARPWISNETDWRAARAPRLGEHNVEILGGDKAAG